MGEDIDTFVERIVRAAEIPNRRRRDELRRELRSHFEESGLTSDGLDAAVSRFGDPAHVGQSLRRVYRRDYLLLYVAKVAACTAAALVAAILIEAVANIRLASAADVWHLSPGFGHAAAFGVLLALALVAAAEATRAPFAWPRALLSGACYITVCACVLSVTANSGGPFVTASVMAAIGVGCARAATAWIVKTFLTLVGFAAVEYVIHQSLGISFGPIRALEASAILLVLWASTIGIVGFSDRTFFNAFRTT